MKKKLRLKGWVKELILMILILGTLFMCLKYIGESTDKAIKECVASGHSQYWCEKGLS